MGLYRVLVRVIKMRKNNTLLVAVVLIALSAVIGITQLKTPNPEEQTPDLTTEVVYADSFLPPEDKRITVRAVPEDVKAISGQGAYPSSVLEITTPQVIDESDLVAFVVITSKGTSFSKFPAHPISVYNASVERVIKGPKIESEIHIVVFEGYLEEDKFIRADSEPVFKVGDEWLLFMITMNYVKDLDLYLLKDSYGPRPLTNVKIENNKLYVISKEIIPRLGIDGLTVDEFIQRYGS